MRALRVFTGFDSTRLALISYADDSATEIEFDSGPYSKDTQLSIGIAGSAAFGLAVDAISGEEAFTQIIHTPSGSIFAFPPSADIIIIPDPFADPTAAGFTFNGDPFPLPEDGYTIGVAGEEHFGIAFDLDNEVAIIDPVHTSSLSIM
jgi:hypothetical protein